MITNCTKTLWLAPDEKPLSTVLVRRLLLAAVILLGLLAPLGCAPSGQSTSQLPSVSASPEIQPDSRIADGSYTVVVTRAGEKKAGVSTSTLNLMMGRNSTIVYTVKFDGDQWAEFQHTDANGTEQGDGGTLEYLDDRQVVLRNGQIDGTYGWMLRGSKLTFTLVSLKGDDSGDDSDERFVMQRTFTREE